MVSDVYHCFYAHPIVACETGIAATAEIRAIESRQSNASPTRRDSSARILALTGMSSLEDKRRAFEAGVDG